jgi:hypothetical protein
MIEDRLDKTVFTFTTPDEADADDIDYWLSKTPTERIEALEHLRRWMYGDEAVDEPLRRDIFSFGKLGDE